MSAFILLSANEAGAVRGPSIKTPTLAALQPIALTDGRFILGAEVLTDPAHAKHFAFMSALPTAELVAFANLIPTAAPVPSLGVRMLSAVKSFFAPDPV